MEGMVEFIPSAYRMLDRSEVERSYDELAEYLWYRLNELGDFDIYVYVRLYRRALRLLEEEELDRNDDISVAIRNAAERSLSPYEWLLVGRR